MKPSDDATPVREAVGIFFDARHLHDAIDELEASGFGHHEIGLLAGEHTVRQALGHVYEQANEAAETPDGPRMAFVRKESLGDGFRTWAGGLVFVGATATGGAAVASAGVLGGALTAATAGAAAVGAVSAAVLGLIIRKSDAEHLEEQVDEGHLLLFVRTRTAGHEQKAVEILSKHCGSDVRVHEVPAGH